MHIERHARDARGTAPGVGATGDDAMLAAELESMGRPAEVEEIRVRPAWQLTFAILAALAAAGTVLSAIAPPAGAVILLLTAAAMYGDLAAGFHTFRLFFPRRDHRQRHVDGAARVAGRARDPDRPSRLWAHGPALRAALALATAPARDSDQPAPLPLLDA